MNQLLYGDNLALMQAHLPDASVDLIYLDPPFNSQRDYNLLFKTPKGHESDAQIEAFKDSWVWADQAERELVLVQRHPHTVAAQMLTSLVDFLGRNAMTAYLVMMTSRLLEMHRVLKPSGSLYLHCDPTAAHYLKVLLDAVFGKERFLNEIIWKRTSAHSSAKRWGPSHDTIFLYSKSDDYCWNRVGATYDEEYVRRFYRFEDANGRRYRLGDLTGAGKRKGDSGLPWRGVDPTAKGRHWAVPINVLEEHYPEVDLSAVSTQEKLDLLDKAGRVHWPAGGKVPALIRYFDPERGTAIQDVITDISPIGAQAAERLGYPTQKPLALLERIIEASSHPGDVVLDPFCGCGTAVHAAHKLKRKWIGIDITHLAVSLIEKRHKDAFRHT